MTGTLRRREPEDERSGGPFLPRDPGVVAPYRLTPQLRLRLSILGGLALALFAVLFLRLWSLEVIAGPRYRAQAQENQLRAFRLNAPRGTIVDRAGRVLVENRALPTVELWPGDVPTRRELDAVVGRLATALAVDRTRLQAEIAARRRDPLTPVRVKVGPSREEVGYLLEHRDDLPGVEIADRSVRRYPQGSTAAQVLGYVGEVSAEQLAAGRDYAVGDTIGQAGVEASYDDVLRGSAGAGVVRLDARGHRRGPRTIERMPTAGRMLRLTLDLRLQRAAERALADAIAQARRNGARAAAGGALVALDPRDGSVLALASNPTYDPGLFSGRVDPEALARLADPAANTPTLNRAVAGLYPPGSTFKPLTALAALEEGVLGPGEAIQCSPQLEVNGQRFRNWDPTVNEPMSLVTALAASCDTYFYDVGLRFYHLPPGRGHPLQEWAARFGVGSRTGIDLGPESNGLLPTPGWRRQHFRTPVDRLWKPGDSIQLAVGQGDLLVTPLAMARLYAAIANGGKLVTPHLGMDVLQAAPKPSRPTVLRRLAPGQPAEVAVDAQALAAVRAGLYQGAHAPYGTSSGVFGSFPVPIAGKTGTAEKFIDVPGYRGLADQAWWCGYGPAESARLVVCAVVENGGFGGEVAAPAALRVFEQFFGVRPSEVRQVKSD